MTSPGATFDVLVLQSHPRAADQAEDALAAAGCRVHSCYDPGSSGFPCRGLLDPDGCPLDQGVDVALLVRNRVLPQPTSLENGAICAIRAGVPVVEQGSPILDPFEPWITTRLGRHDDVVAGCEAAVARGMEALRRELLQQTATVLDAAGHPVDDLECTIERAGKGLQVRISGPPVDRQIQQALAVRMFSTVQRSGEAASPLDVHYTPVPVRHAPPPVRPDRGGQGRDSPRLALGGRHPQRGAR